MLTLRLDAELENNINHIASQMNISKSELIRKSINEFINNREQPSPWILGENAFGRYSSGQTDNAQNRKTIIKTKLLAKNETNID